jgi:hypothetical protein
MTAFTPQVGRIFIDPSLYPSGTNNQALYQIPKLEDIADVLVTLSAGWAEPWTRVYTGGGYYTHQKHTVLERANGSNKSQIILAYATSTSYIRSPNQVEVWPSSYGFWLAYKSSLSGANIDYAALDPEYDDSFISSGNAFRFAHAMDSSVEHFYNQEWYFVWLAEESSRRVVLICERPLHSIGSILIMGEDVISDPYNVGTGKWRGDGDISHPEPDVYPELFLGYSRGAEGNWYPLASRVNTLQWYGTDHEVNWRGTSSGGITVREDLLGPSPSSAPPYHREAMMIYDNPERRHGTVWSGYDASAPDTPVSGNTLKGLVDPDFVSLAARSAFSTYELLNGGDFLHIKDGLCVGWDPALGSMPT